MISEDERISAALHELAEYGPGGDAPVATLLRRGRRQRRARTAVLCTAGVTGAGVIAALTSGAGAVGHGAATATGPQPGAAGTQSAQTTQVLPVSLALAAQTSDSSSFRFTVNTTTEEDGADGGTPRSDTLTGAFDPVHDRGFIADGDQGGEAATLTLGDTCYARSPGGTWLVLRCATPASDPANLGSARSVTEDPSAVLRVLEGAGDATYVGRTGTGASAVDTWKFTYTHSMTATGLVTSLGYTASGTVAVDVATSHVAKVDYTIGADAGGHSSVTYAATTKVAITYSDYGVPVDVTAPVTSPHR